MSYSSTNRVTTMFAMSTYLEQAANKFLLAHGCSPDGRPLEQFDPRQVRFEVKVAWFASDRATRQLATREE